MCSKKIYDVNICKNIVTETNIQLAHVHSLGTGHHLSIAELGTFIAMRLQTRVSPRREVDDYWASTNDPLVDPSPWMKVRMTEHRFCALNHNLRFDYNTVLTRIISNSLALREPGTVIAWDESIIPYQGLDCPFIRFVPGKPHPHGIFVNSMCDESKFCCGLWLWEHVRLLYRFNCSFIRCFLP